MRTIQTMQQADEFFASLPDGFDAPQDFAAALPAAEPAVKYIPVAGTAGKTTVAALTAGILKEAGFRTGLYTAGSEPLSARIKVDGQPLTGAAAEAYAEAADRILEGTLLSRPAAELAAACSCFGAAGCFFAVVETADGALASATSPRKARVRCRFVSCVKPPRPPVSSRRRSRAASRDFNAFSLKFTAINSRKVNSPRNARLRRAVRSRGYRAPRRDSRPGAGPL